MATITISLNSKIFHIACEDSHEKLVEDAANKVIKKVEELKKHSPSAMTEYLLLLCAISMQNEISSSKSGSGENNLELITKNLEEISELVNNLSLK